MKIAIIAHMPVDGYSGGRYHAWILAEALAVNNEVYFILDNYPLFANDFMEYPHHHEIMVVYDKSFCPNMPEVESFDYVVVVPSGDTNQDYYDNCILFAVKKEARLVLLNFESINWFNAYAKIPKSDRLGKMWKKVVDMGCMVLCSAHESIKWAKEYYTGNIHHTVFDCWNPPINNLVADEIDCEKEDRVIAFVRLADTHKGGDDLLKVMNEKLRGYTLVIVNGYGKVADSYINKLERVKNRYGIDYEILEQINDYQKFCEIKKAKYLLFPSYFEGYGYPPIEAQYCNTICIAYDLPVLRETSEKSIILCEYGNPEDMKEKLISCLSNSFMLPNIRENKVALFSEQTKKINDIFLKHLNDNIIDLKRYKCIKLRDKVFEKPLCGIDL